MQVTETKNEGLKRDFKIVVPAADIEARIGKRLQELARTVKLPGFRPGKVPPQLLRKRFGASVLGEVIEGAVNESSQQTLSERAMRPAQQPKIEITQFEEGGDLEFTMAFEVLPEIPPVDFAALKLERPVVEVEETEVEETLERMAKANRKTEKQPDETTAENGNIVVIDFVGKIDGKEFPGGKAEGYALELGSGGFIEGFEDQLVGTKAGQDVAVKVTFPKEYGAAELAGKDAVFDVLVKEVRALRAAEVDDEFAQKAGAENLDALRKSIRERLEQEYRGFSRMRLKRALLDALAETCDFEVPEGLAENEFEGIWKQFEEQRKQNPEAVEAEYGGRDEDDIREEFRTIAERRLRLGLFLAEVARENNIQVTKEDMNRALVAEAQKYPGYEQKVFEYYKQHPEAMESLQAPVLEDRVVDFVLELASVTDKPVSREILLRDPDEEPATKPAAKKKAPAKKKVTAKKPAGEKKADAEKKAPAKKKAASKKA